MTCCEGRGDNKIALLFWYRGEYARLYETSFNRANGQNTAKNEFWNEVLRLARTSQEARVAVDDDFFSDKVVKCRISPATFNTEERKKIIVHSERTHRRYCQEVARRIAVQVRIIQLGFPDRNFGLGCINIFIGKVKCTDTRLSVRFYMMKAKDCRSSRNSPA